VAYRDTDHSLVVVVVVVVVAEVRERLAVSKETTREFKWKGSISRN
jgi:hypothetical protein